MDLGELMDRLFGAVGWADVDAARAMCPPDMVVKQNNNPEGGLDELMATDGVSAIGDVAVVVHSNDAGLVTSLSEYADPTVFASLVA